MRLRQWEGRIVAFVLGAVSVPSAIVSILSTNGTFSMVGCGIGVLLRMFWVLSVLLVHGNHSEPEHEETILMCTKEFVPLYAEIDKKNRNNSENCD
jgi:hypothetical protein